MRAIITEITGKHIYFFTWTLVGKKYEVHCVVIRNSNMNKSSLNITIPEFF